MHMSRRGVVAALGSTMLVPLVAGQALGAAQSKADQDFAALAKKWLDGAMKLSPVSATQIGDHRFDAQLDDMSAAGRAAGLAFYKDLLAALDGIDKTKLSRPNQSAGMVETVSRQTVACASVSSAGGGGRPVGSCVTTDNDASDFRPLWTIFLVSLRKIVVV